MNPILPLERKMFHLNKLFHRNKCNKKYFMGTSRKRHKMKIGKELAKLDLNHLWAGEKPKTERAAHAPVRLRVLAALSLFLIFYARQWELAIQLEG